jgi:predicted transcriptional regulator
MNENKVFGQITLVTPPNIVDHTANTFCIINFSESDKDKFLKFLNNYYTILSDNFTIYIADEKTSRADSKWLTKAIEKSNNVITKSLKGFNFTKGESIKNMKEYLNG